MTKQTKMLLGAGVVAAAAYLYWKSKQTTTATTAKMVGNLSGGVGNVQPLGSKKMNAGGSQVVGQAQHLGSSSFGKKQFSGEVGNRQF